MNLIHYAYIPLWCVICHMFTAYNYFLLVRVYLGLVFNASFNVTFVMMKWMKFTILKEAIMEVF